MYKNTGVQIPIGTLGFYTDDPQEKTPAGSTRDARNVTLVDGLLAKERGSRRLNFSAVPGGVKSLFDWFPNDYHQYVMMVGGDGKVYYWSVGRDQGEIKVLSGDAAPSSLVLNKLPIMLQFGAELINLPRKLLILTGSQPQVIEGDVKTRRNIPTTKAALDWTNGGQSNFPKNGFISKGRLVLYGCPNSPHTLYISQDTDQESFQGANAYFLSVFPGQGTGILTHFQYKNQTFLVKKPYGLYYLNDTDSNPNNWSIVPAVLQFTAASLLSGVECLDDLIIANSNGGLTSLSATQKYGQVTYAEIFRNLRCEKFQRTSMNNAGNEFRSSIFWQFKKQAMFTYRSKGSNKNDYICYVDLQDPANPKVLWSNKDQANMLCLRRQKDGTQTPMYASDDGFVYLMDQTNKVVNGLGYTSYFATPHLDFGWADPQVAGQNKTFQFLELEFNPTGRWNIYVETYIDGVYFETVPFKVSYGPVLDDFQLDTARLSGKIPRAVRMPIRGNGRRISFKIFHNTAYESFEITGMKVYFKVSGNQQKAGNQ